LHKKSRKRVLVHKLYPSLLLEIRTLRVKNHAAKLVQPVSEKITAARDILSEKKYFVTIRLDLFQLIQLNDVLVDGW